MPARNRSLLVLCVVLIAGTLTAQQSEYWCPAQGVAYGVSFKRAAEHVLHVDAVTHQPAAELQLPVWNALYQVRDFAVNVNRVKVYEGVPEWMCDGCDTRDATASKRDTATWILATSGNYPCVTFSYDVLVNDPGAFGASLDSQHAFLNWAELLVFRPEQRSEAVSVKLLDVPRNWALRDGGTFGARESGALESASAEAASYDRLVDTPALFGKLYQTDFVQDGATFHIAVDSPDVDLPRLQAMLQKITASAIEWMQDRPFKEYTFLYLIAHGAGSGGMEHAYSTAIDVGPERMKQDVANAASVSAHEFFHLWNVKRIRPASLEPVDYTHEQPTRALWFSEGMTSTAADIFQYRAGITDEKRALSHLASIIAGLQARPARLTQSVEESSVDTWLDGYPGYHRPERSISYYPKGEILGFLIDLEMRRLTNGRRCLRDLFQYMNEHYAKKGIFFDDSEGVRLALEALTGNDFRDFFARYISGVDELPYDRFSYVGLTLARHQSEQITAGIVTSRAPGRAAAIIRVEEGSTAARLRLIPGDIILQADGKSLSSDFNQIVQRHDLRTPIRLKVVSVTGEQRELDLPLTTRKIEEFQFEELPNVTDTMRARRTAFLRGEAEVATQ